jgi:hypothetical protein
MMVMHVLMIPVMQMKDAIKLQLIVTMMIYAPKNLVTEPQDVFILSSIVTIPINVPLILVVSLLVVFMIHWTVTITMIVPLTLVILMQVALIHQLFAMTMMNVRTIPALPPLVVIL